MFVTCTRAMMFAEPKVPKALNSPVSLKGMRKFTIGGSPAPQEIPDWIRGLVSYKEAITAGVIKEFASPAVPVSAGSGTKSKAAK